MVFVTFIMEENLIYDAMYDVEDPEVGVNIIDLGLVYDVKTAPEKITITLTLTSPGCPLQDEIETQIKNVLVEFGKPIVFHWVFQPVWSPAFITDEGREQMVALGAHVPVYR